MGDPPTVVPAGNWSVEPLDVIVVLPICVEVHETVVHETVVHETVELETVFAEMTGL